MLIDDESGNEATLYEEQHEYWLYQPPWRERIPGADPLKEDIFVEYGPASAGALHVMMTEWYGSKAGGALWDEEDAARISSVRKPDPNPLRHDADAALAFLHVHGGDLPKRQAQAVHWFYSGRSQGRIARDLEVAPSTVITWIKRFRKRLRIASGSPGSP